MIWIVSLPFAALAAALIVIRVLRGVRQFQEIQATRVPLGPIPAHRKSSDVYHDERWLPLCERLAEAAAQGLNRPLTRNERRDLAWTVGTRHRNRAFGSPGGNPPSRRQRRTGSHAHRNRSPRSNRLVSCRVKKTDFEEANPRTALTRRRRSRTHERYLPASKWASAEGLITCIVTSECLNFVSRHRSTN